MDLPLWLDTITTVATVLAVIVSARAVFLARDAVRISESGLDAARKDTYVATMAGVRSTLSELIAAAGEFDHRLLPYWKVPSSGIADQVCATREDLMDDKWIEREILVHAACVRMLTLGNVLASELEGMFDHVPNAFDASDVRDTVAWVRGFGVGAWFAPYAALVAKEPATPLNMMDYIKDKEYGGLRQLAVNVLFKDVTSGALPHPRAANVAIEFFTDARDELMDRVLDALARASELVASVEPLGDATSSKFLLKSVDGTLHEERVTCADTRYRLIRQGEHPIEGTAVEILREFIPGYEQYRFDPRVARARRDESAIHHAEKAQAQVLARGITADEATLMTRDKRLVLEDPDGGPLRVWEHRNPLYLVASVYAPSSDVSAPSGEHVRLVHGETEVSYLRNFGELKTL